MSNEKQTVIRRYELSKKRSKLIRPTLSKFFHWQCSLVSIDINSKMQGSGTKTERRNL
jgi:hypothetical protein